MAFWSDPGIEPKRAYRWKVQADGLIGGNYWIATKVDKPSFKVGEYSHKLLNHTFYYPGRVEWDQLTMTIVDPGGLGRTAGVDEADLDMAKQLMKNLYGSGYRDPDSAGVADSTVSKISAVGSLGNLIITQLIPSNDVNRVNMRTGDKFTLNNAWILDAKFGSLDYSSEEAVTIDLTIRYDWAKLEGVNEP